MPIIQKESNGILNCTLAYISEYVFSKIGTKAQKVYNSHICPKYPKAAFLKAVFLNTLKQIVPSKEVAFFRKGPLGTKRISSKPPKEAKIEIYRITFSQEKERILSFNKCGNAVPKTKAPTKKPKAFPNPFW